MTLIEQFVDEKPETPLKDMFRPKHEMNVEQSKGRFRWTCVCGAQMAGWSDDMEQVKESYARHTGLVEKRRA
jgi:hypothetical protein